jgi:multicomponent Na+:H+ antiporter subunit E
MIYVIWNILLALIWAAASAQMSLMNLAVGYFVGFAVLWFMHPIFGETKYFSKAGSLIRFSGYLVKEIVRSNLRVAYDVATPTMYMRPGIVAVPLDAESEIEIAVMANLITLTPGTMSLGVSRDRKHLYVHSMFIEDPEELKQEIKRGIERPVLELLR